LFAQPGLIRLIYL